MIVEASSRGAPLLLLEVEGRGGVTVRARRAGLRVYEESITLPAVLSGEPITMCFKLPADLVAGPNGTVRVSVRAEQANVTRAWLATPLDHVAPLLEVRDVSVSHGDVFTVP